MNIRQSLYNSLFGIIDSFYLRQDKKDIIRASNTRLIPKRKWRRGGKISYAEWAHVIGIFQSILDQYVDKKDRSTILDIGCGTGILGIACEPYVKYGSKFTGIDINESDINHCRRSFTIPGYQFIHIDKSNPLYIPDQKKELSEWPFEDQTFDIVTALSVWTHLNELESRFYLNEVKRVLKPNGISIITFFVKEDMTDSMNTTFHSSTKNWNFNRRLDDSDHWYTTEWSDIPEEAIAISKDGLEHLVQDLDMEIIKIFRGNWKDTPGLYFQDIVVMRK